MNLVINPIYKKKCRTPSDINEHMPVLYEYGLKINHITEFGTRYGCSTVALLNSNPQKMISYDLQKMPEVDTIIDYTKKANINYVFTKADTLTIDIENTDLLFIDTFHSYNQLYSELLKHHTKVNNYIIMHDTTTYGYKDMPYHGPISINLDKNITKEGLLTAIQDFIFEYSEWNIHKILTNNNGLTILSKS
jgi:hypothetical protein